MDKKFKVGQTVVLEDSECVIKAVAITKNGKFYTVSRGDSTIEGVPETELKRTIGKDVDAKPQKIEKSQPVQAYQKPKPEKVVEPKGSEEPQE